VRNVSLEQLIVLAVFLLVPLVNLLARWLRQRRFPTSRSRFPSGCLRPCAWPSPSPRSERNR
jgi:hypothetical protein